MFLHTHTHDTHSFAFLITTFSCLFKAHTSSVVQSLQFLFFTSKPCPAPSAQSVVLWSLDVVCVCVCVWAPCLFNCGWGTETGVAKKWSNVFTCIMFRLKESLLFVWTGLHHVIGNVSQITVHCHGTGTSGIRAVHRKVGVGGVRPLVKLSQGRKKF